MRPPTPRFFRFVLVALITSLIGVSTAFPSNAAGEAEKLKSTKAQIAEIRKRLAAAKGKAAEISKEVEKLDQQIASLNRQIESGQHDISSLESDIRSMQAQIAKVQERYDKAADASNARARRLYVQGPAESVAMLFTADSIVELTRLQFLMEKSSEQDSKIIVDAARLRSDLLDKQNELNRIKGSLTAQKDWLRTRKNLADAARRDRAAALASVEKEIAAAQAHIEGLEADSSRLEAALRKSASRGSGNVSGEGGAASSGGFIRPVSGGVTSGFGRRWGRAHTGVDLDGNTGDPIRAAKAGTVLGVSCGSGYGICSLVDHGGGVVTLYAHMSRKVVGGGRVERGQLIGYVGCTGSCTGSHLHFEVRVNGTPQNPMRYL
ncbi:MAG TPA: peptidoglycan DD-metalloendopeptidase family protein [Actinomycetota bacterium]|nr:peptidoglycan DD-metalloendopeptidase family protein [Actinomycetota bacterium]